MDYWIDIQAHTNYVSRATIKLLSSYLTNRKCFVSVDGFNSDNKIRTARPPQGEVIPPLLYNVHVAGIPALC